LVRIHTITLANRRADSSSSAPSFVCLRSSHALRASIIIADNYLIMSFSKPLRTNSRPRPFVRHLHSHRKSSFAGRFCFLHHLHLPLIDIPNSFSTSYLFHDNFRSNRPSSCPAALTRPSPTRLSSILVVLVILLNPLPISQPPPTFLPSQKRVSNISASFHF
jgi:hypothetical protein